MDPSLSPNDSSLGSFTNPFRSQRTRQSSQATSSNLSPGGSGRAGDSYHPSVHSNVNYNTNFNTATSNGNMDTIVPVSNLYSRYSFGDGRGSLNPAGNYGPILNRGDQGVQGIQSVQGVQSTVMSRGADANLLPAYNPIMAPNPYSNDLRTMQCAHGQLFGSSCSQCSQPILPLEPTHLNRSMSTFSSSMAPLTMVSVHPVPSTRSSQPHRMPQVAQLHDTYHIHPSQPPQMLQLNQHNYISHPDPSYDSHSLSASYEGPGERENITKNQDGKYQCDICFRNFRRPSRAQTCRNGHGGIKSCPCDGLCGDPDCQAVFASKDGLRRHCAAEERKFVTCDNCNTRILRQNIARHRKRCMTEEDSQSEEPTRLVLPIPIIFT